MKADPRGIVEHLRLAERNGNNKGLADFLADTIVEHLEALEWIEAQAATVHCNYITGPECFTVTLHDSEGGTVLPDECFHGATILKAVRAARLATTTESKNSDESESP